MFWLMMSRTECQFGAMSCDMRHDEPTSLTQGAGVVPPAYVEPHIVAAGTADGCGYGGVALSLVEREAFAVLRVRHRRRNPLL